jgi:hypothetical protein
LPLSVNEFDGVVSGRRKISRRLCVHLWLSDFLETERPLYELSVKLWMPSTSTLTSAIRDHVGDGITAYLGDLRRLSCQQATKYLLLRTG